MDAGVAGFGVHWSKESENREIDTDFDQLIQWLVASG